MCSRERASELKKNVRAREKEANTLDRWTMESQGEANWQVGLGRFATWWKRKSGVLAMGKHSASVEKVEQAVIGGASAIVVRSAVGESLEAIDKQSSIVGNSVVGEPSSGDIPLPSVLPALASGQKRLSGYNVIEILNSGSYGDVYKASRRGSGEMFAVKVMR